MKYQQSGNKNDNMKNSFSTNISLNKTHSNFTPKNLFNESDSSLIYQENNLIKENNNNKNNKNNNKENKKFNKSFYKSELNNLDTLLFGKLSNKKDKKTKDKTFYLKPISEETKNTTDEIAQFNNFDTNQKISLKNFIV
jgi:hypothetical protein